MTVVLLERGGHRGTPTTLHRPAVGTTGTDSSPDDVLPASPAPASQPHVSASATTVTGGGMCPGMNSSLLDRAGGWQGRVVAPVASRRGAVRAAWHTTAPRPAGPRRARATIHPAGRRRARPSRPPELRRPRR